VEHSLAHLEELQPQQMAEALADHPQRVNIEAEHYFAPGLYGRKVTLAAGTLAIGKKHRTTHLSVLAKGSLIVRGVDDLPDHRMVAGDVMVTPAGSQRAVYAEEDAVFVCIHPNPENQTDLEKLEALFIEAPALEGPQCPG
jgi:quercetin dioxygenase-like cupin family protein